MYTDIDFEYHPHLATTFNQLKFKQFSLHMLGKDIITAEPMHIHCSEQLHPLDFHIKVQLEVTIE